MIVAQAPRDLKVPQVPLNTYVAVIRETRYELGITLRVIPTHKLLVLLV